MAHHGSPTAITFQRKIGLASGIGFVVGTIIGSGIFISPRGVFANAGCSYYGAIVVWIICGLYSMIGSIVYSEIGTTILRSGGDYAYIQCGFGSLVSFLYLWLNVVVIRPASHAILALTFAYYLIGAYLDNPADCTGRHVHFELASRVTAAIALTLLSVVNCANVKLAIQIQNVFTLLKILALTAIIISGIGLYLYDRYLLNISESTVPSLVDHSSCDSWYSLSIYNGLFAFGGWNYINIVTEELKNPYKNLPIAALAGIFITTVIYIFTNISYFVTLTGNEILQSPAIALVFVRKIIGPIGIVLISLSIAASTLGSLNATLFTTSRLFCIGAQDKHLPSIIGMLHYERCTPVVSLIFSLLITFAMLFANDIYSLINYFSFTYWLWTGVAVSSGIYLRHRSPDMNRPIKLPLIILYLFALLCYLLTGLAFINDPYNSSKNILLMLTGLPVHYLLTFLRNKDLQIANRFSCGIQKLLMVVETDSSISASADL